MSWDDFTLMLKEFSEAEGVYRGNCCDNGNVMVFIFAPKHENVSHDV